MPAKKMTPTQLVSAIAVILFILFLLVVWRLFLAVRHTANMKADVQQIKDRAAEQDARIRQLDQQLTATDDKFHQAAKEQQATQARLEERDAQLTASEDKLTQATQHGRELELALASRKEKDKSQQEKLDWLEQARDKLAKEFQHLSAQIFEERSEKFRQGNREGMEQLLKPFREQIKEFRERVDKVHSEGSQAQAALREQLTGLKNINLQMQEDARHLTQALKGESKTQGDWGEMILERLLEQSGLQEGREYETQSTHHTDENRRLRPDVIIHLPDEKDVIVDSKVSLKAYEEFCSADNDEKQSAALKRHLASVRQHVKDLSSKEYQSLNSLKSLDFVLLFIPIEGAFMTAIQQDVDLFRDAFERNVMLVSPTTLLVTLRTIHNIWRYEDQSRNAIAIADRAGKICDQVSRLEESWSEVGGRLDKAQNAWSKGYKQLSQGKGNLLRQAQQLQQMGAKAKRTLPEPQDDPA